jgi:hypothetical protein
VEAFPNFDAPSRFTNNIRSEPKCLTDGKRVPFYKHLEQMHETFMSSAYSTHPDPEATRKHQYRGD